MPYKVSKQCPLSLPLPPQVNIFSSHKHKPLSTRERKAEFWGGTTVGATQGPLLKSQPKITPLWGRSLHFQRFHTSRSSILLSEPPEVCLGPTKTRPKSCSFFWGDGKRQSSANLVLNCFFFQRKTQRMRQPELREVAETLKMSENLENSHL